MNLQLTSLSSRVSKQRCCPAQTQLIVESLEDRRVLSAVTMTANEQLLVELINRARANPLAEVDRYSGISDLNQDLSPGTISSTPKQPLAPHQALVTAAGDHSEDMLARDFFSHTNPEGQSPSDRAREAGYPAGAGENIAWGGSTASIDEIAHVYARHESLFLSAGHRRNILGSNYRELGVGVRYGVFTTTRNWNASMVTEMFASRSGNPFLTGVAYTDTVVDDDFYTVGEGARNVVITATDASNGNTFTEMTGPSGGYAMQLPAGTYTVIASGGGINGEIRNAGVVIGNQNVKVDVITTDNVVPIDTNGVAIVGFVDGVWWRADSTGTSLVTSQWTDWPQPNGWQNIQLADVNGDGSHEVIGRRGNGEWWVTRATGSDTYMSEAWGSWSTAVTWSDVQVADVNGDDRDDIVGRTNAGQWWVALSSGTGFTNERWGAWSRRQMWNDVSVGDFTGDGRDDIAGRLNNGTWWVAASNGQEFQNSKWGRWSPNIDWQHVQVGDFNNDGRDDILGRASAAWWVAESSGSAFSNQSWGSWSAAVAWQDVRVGDFNNDGRDDIVGRGNGNLWVARSTGSNFVSEIWDQWNSSVQWKDVLIADFNLDGRDDIVGRANDRWWVAQSSGEDFNTRAWGDWPPTAAFDEVLAGVVS